MDVERKITAAQHYVLRGWQLFTVSESKRPWQNCAECPVGAHDGETCEHVFCHGHQAATADPAVIEAALTVRPHGLLAVRCGAVSGIVVVDAEGTDRSGAGRTGLDVLEDYEWWGDTLKATTSSGGLHLFYRYPEAGSVASRNKVLPNVDIKGDGGYVLLPPAAGRAWLNWSPKGGCPDPAAPDLDAWLSSAPGGGTGTSSGRGMIKVGPGEKVPAGARYEFTRGLVYKLRRQGVTRAEAEEICRMWWARYEQPPVAEYELPWRQVEYELERVWARVEPEPKAGLAAQNWARKIGSGGNG